MAISPGFLTCVSQHSPYYIQTFLIILAKLTLSVLIVILDLNMKGWFFIINHNNGDNNTCNKAQCLRHRKYKCASSSDDFYLHFWAPGASCQDGTMAKNNLAKYVSRSSYGSYFLGFYLCFLDLF